jgi:hypothetical protein
MHPLRKALPLLPASYVNARSSTCVARRMDITIPSGPGSCHPQSHSRRPLPERPGKRPQAGEGRRHLHLRLGGRSKEARDGVQARPCYREPVRLARPPTPPVIESSGRIRPLSRHDRAPRDLRHRPLQDSIDPCCLVRHQDVLDDPSRLHHQSAGRRAFALDDIDAPSSGCTAIIPTLPSTHPTPLFHVPLDPHEPCLRFLDMSRVTRTSQALQRHDAGCPNRAWRGRASSGYWYQSYEPEIP